MQIDECSEHTGNRLNDKHDKIVFSYRELRLHWLPVACKPLLATEITKAAVAQQSRERGSLTVVRHGYWTH